MTALIYRPAKSAMQSGTTAKQHWVLRYTPQAAKSVDPLMGWTGSSDMQSQIKLSFDSKDEAIGYAERNGLDYIIKPVHSRKRNIQSYADNFK